MLFKSRLEAEIAALTRVRADVGTNLTDDLVRMRGRQGIGLQQVAVDDCPDHILVFTDILPGQDVIE